MERLTHFMQQSSNGYIGWFGKLPAVGDFASRGIPQPLREVLHSWIAEGMADLAARQPDEWREAYLVSPVWHFCANPGVWGESAALGCIAPSIDKIGRCSPLIALRTFDATGVRQALPPNNRWLYQVDALLRRVIAERLPVEMVLPELERSLASELEVQTDPGSAGNILAELDILNHHEPEKAWFSWPDLPDLFEGRAGRSFWWAEPSPRLPPRQMVHSGPPDSDLFAMLMGGWLR